MSKVTQLMGGQKLELEATGHSCVFKRQIPGRC